MTTGRGRGARSIPVAKLCYGCAPVQSLDAFRARPSSRRAPSRRATTARPPTSPRAGTSTNLGVDPLYTDASLSSALYWDLALQSTSPVRNSGNPSSTYYDPDGTYAAIGAYGGPYADDW